MAVVLNLEKIEIFLRARRELNYTQLELSGQSNIALRTIKDFESGRRRSFNESTIITLCRALNLDYNELFGDAKQRRLQRRLVTLAVGSGLVLAAIAVGYSVFLTGKDQASRKDWILPEAELKLSHFSPDWGDENGINVNYYHLDQVANAGDTVDAALKWSYHFVDGPPPSTPKYYINAFTQWNPDEEIKIFEGILSGEGSDTLNFTFVCPEDPGLYDVRVFFSSSFGPISSFYGHPPPNQLINPNTAPFVEIAVEVIR